MADYTEELEPDWDTPITVVITPVAIIDSVFATADSAHTGYETCIDPKLIVTDITATDESSDNYCRLVEQEYVEDGEPDITWHDWTVEMLLDGTFVVGHWRVQVNASPADWDWCAAEAEKAFVTAGVLVGKRVRKGITIDEPRYDPRRPRTHH